MTPRRLIVLNNYPLDTLWQSVREQQTPDHLLFGVNWFAEAGWDVRCVPCGESGPGRIVNTILRAVRWPVPFGDLDQQRRAARWLNECDLVYSPCQTQTHALSYLRAVGLLRRPIVGLAHHVMNRGRLSAVRAPFLRWQLSGTDALPSLSRAVAAEINGLAPGKSEVVAWGPDAAFCRASTEAGQGVLAVGRTGRDFSSFGIGASRSGAPAAIICLAANVTPAFTQFTRNVEVSIQPASGWMGYPELTRRYAAARAIAIPLYQQESLAGLSTLMDALGVGRPVVMTRHPLIDLDIEAAGIGRWIDAGDADAWAEAIAWFDQHPDEAMAMGARARRLVDDGLHSGTFAKRMLDIFERALNS